ncbi:50S ribosomal protein L25/general stress protein Ctc [Chryseomicrobium excrementi]|uniref:Large ribosomal subunit protein bL25 n=2 Tax=Chryseomicrobium excrementi TaxID=2041346 RepID=A0A2M9EWR9_9BACL|nr:50S ribosomal protein L25/general stress protein Ctc [Chryseomicrobium excrementi]PJK15638.1 50S ribosomal protein L25/general stress protein Ctc [Chryseomicrobium excrementi]
MTMTKVTTQTRESKKENTSLRAKGFVPAVVYGYKTDSKAIAVEEIELIKVLREVGRNGVMKLDVDGKTINAVLTDYQQDPIKGQILHADFLAINMSEELEVAVTVTPVGDAVGVKEGGSLTQPNREVTVKVKPSDIPDHIEVDVSELNIGETLTLGEVRDKIDFDVQEEDDYALVSIAAPRSDEELEELDSTEDEETTEEDATDVEATEEAPEEEKAE